MVIPESLAIEFNMSFEERAIATFGYQAVHNKIYAEYVSRLGMQIDKVTSIGQIPFLPISFFKKHKVITGGDKYESIFESSGTTGVVPSRHYVKDLKAYLSNAQRLLEEQYSILKDYHFLALLPSYLERNTSSLVFMMDHFIKQSKSEYSGFYLNNIQELVERLKQLSQHSDRKVMLVGVTFALLDLAENYQIDFPELIVMETGGMKGRRKEMIRSEVHEVLKNGFNVSAIHSEYGMTELLSQAYSHGNGVFEGNDQLRILIRDINDPFSYLSEGRMGGINVIDLANEHSCAFIETQDLGRKLSQSTFEVLGRFDNSDIRGCSLMTA